MYDYWYLSNSLLFTFNNKFLQCYNFCMMIDDFTIHYSLITWNGRNWYETRQTVFPTKKYFNVSECKNICKTLVLYTMYILLHIATIQKGSYFEVFLKPFWPLACFSNGSQTTVKEKLIFTHIYIIDWLN